MEMETWGIFLACYTSLLEDKLMLSLLLTFKSMEAEKD